MGDAKILPQLSEDGDKKTIASRVSHELRQAILRGDMTPGSKINLDRVRTSYDISLSPLREALSRLAADGLVELEDQRGYRVAPVSASNLAEVTRLRVEFESLALKHSIEQGDIEWESDVMRSLYRLNRIVRDPALPESLEAWEGAHNDFHLQLIRGCKMPLLLRFCSVLHNLNDRYRRLFLASNPGDRDVRGEHIAIAEAAVARRSSEACSALRHHIDRTGANLKKALALALNETTHAGGD
jgi:DNA-binding GntR family transcriptional regulator